MRNGRLRGIGWLTRTGRLARLARQMGFGRNALRRRTDRIEAWISAALLAAFLIGAPLLTTGFGHWVHQAGLREQRAQQSWHQTAATLIVSAPALPPDELRLQWQDTVRVPARWPGPAGQMRVGEVSVRVGSRVGEKVRIWVNGSGHVTAAPLGGPELTRRVIGAEVAAPVALAVFLLGLGCLARRLLNRRRLADWEAAWASIGPRWSRHRN